MAASPHVHVTGPVPSAIFSALAESFALLDAPSTADGILVTLPTEIDATFLDETGPQLRVVANYGVGVDNIDLNAARERGIVVANTPDVLTETTAEFAIALTLALLRRVVEGDRLLRERRPWEFSVEFMLGEGLHGKRFAVIGPGRIGLATARLAEAFGAIPVLAGRDVDLHAILGAADIVSLHCPLTPETRHLLDAPALAAMRPTAVLVNTARGAIVDERALIAALQSHAIAGAALDVHEHEPSVAAELLSLENVVVTPHLGSATRETRQAMGMLAVSALRAVLLEDRRPPNIVA
jgi:lactate dehydrogenase-like 2-hydroxyacid dehydrogenase